MGRFIEKPCSRKGCDKTRIKEEEAVMTKTELLFCSLACFEIFAEKWSKNDTEHNNNNYLSRTATPENKRQVEGLIVNKKTMIHALEREDQFR